MRKKVSKNIISTIMILALTFCMGSTSYAQMWSVNANTGTDSINCINSPSTNKCKSIQYVFNNVNLAENDIVEVEQGTYTETVTTGGDDGGTSGSPVILRAKPGDTVIIDGQNTRANAIEVNVGYFTVDGFRTNNHIGYSIYVNGDSSPGIYGVTIRNNNINIGIGGDKGIHSRYVTNVIIENNNITTDVGAWNVQNDGIGCGYCNSPTFRNNSIILRNSIDIGASTTHIDCIQMWASSNVSVYGNYCEMTSDAPYRQGIYIEGITTGANLGAWYVYNNVVMGSFGTAIKLAQKSDIAEMHCYNNTARNIRTQGAVYSLDGDNVYYKNNIGINANAVAERVAVFDSAIQTLGRINGNIYYNSSGGDIINLGGTLYTWAEWKNTGHDQIGYNSDPGLDSEFRPMNGNSLAIDHGVSLPYFNFDRDGVNRPQGSAWDIGAYEYCASGNCPTSDGGSDTGSNTDGDASASGGSGCGFVKDSNGKGQGAKGEGLAFAILLIISLTGIALLKKFSMK